MDRRLSAIMAADVVGYSRLMGEDEAGTLAALKAHRAEFTDPTVAEHHGRIVKLMGDGVLIEFASVVDALECAVVLQRGMAERNADIPKDRLIEFRIGINLGDIIVDGDDIYGNGVNVAARLETLAEPGGICLSGRVLDQVKSNVDVGFAYLGPQTVKNVADRINVYKVLLDPKDAGKIVGAARPSGRTWRWLAAAMVAFLVAAGVGSLWYLQSRPELEPAAVAEMPHPLTDKPSIAVLPFTAMGGEPDQEYFADGVTDDLITDLTKVSGVLVAARDAVFSFKGRSVEPKEVGRRLGVSHVLSGSIRRSGDRVRVTAHLTDVDSGIEIWSERYDRDGRDIFSLQNDLAEKIAGALATEFSSSERALLQQQTTKDPQAYDLLLRARAAYRKWTPKTNIETIELLREAIDRDTGFAEAYVELANAYFQRWILGGSRDETLLDEALGFAEKAVSLNPDLPSGFTMLGWVHLWRREHSEALAAMNRSIAIDPNNTDTLARLSEAHMFAGEPEKALQYINEARRRVRAEPYFYGFWTGEAYFYLGQNDKAITELTEALESHPSFFPARRFLAAVLADSGRIEEAKQQIAKVLARNPSISIGLLRRQLPFKRAADLERQLAALHEAGLPE